MVRRRETKSAPRELRGLLGEERVDAGPEVLRSGAFEKGGGLGIGPGELISDLQIQHGGGRAAKKGVSGQGDQDGELRLGASIHRPKPSEESEEGDLGVKRVEFRKALK